MELWAAIDLLEGAAVTLVQGRASERTVWPDSPVRLAKRWQDEGADGIHIIDLDAAFGTGSNAETARAIIRGSSIPVQVGGGIRTTEEADRWIEDGATRVVLGTMAFSDQASAQRLVESHGPERVVAAADYNEGFILTKGWRESHPMPVVEGARRLEALGFKIMLTTAVGRDGMGNGPDVETLRDVTRATRMRVIASGGIRDSLDLVELERAGASAAVIGRALYEGTVRLSDAKRMIS